jgi:hypothetical protein
VGDETSPQAVHPAGSDGSVDTPAEHALVRGGVVDRPSERALWRAVASTLRSVVLDHVDDPYARVQTERLIDLAEYARDRGPDPSAARRAAIAELLSGDDPTAVLLDEDDPRRPALRALLRAHLDEDLAAEERLLAHFPAPGNDRVVADGALGSPHRAAGP